MLWCWFSVLILLSASVFGADERIRCGVFKCDPDNQYCDHVTGDCLSCKLLCKNIGMDACQKNSCPRYKEPVPETPPAPPTQEAQETVEKKSVDKYRQDPTDAPEDTGISNVLIVLISLLGVVIVIVTLLLVWKYKDRLCRNDDPENLVSLFYHL